MTMLVPDICFASDARDSVVMNRIWNFHKQLYSDIDGKECNIYMSYTMETKRRNVTLWVIPTMYQIARGEREYAGEAYGKLKFGNKKYDYLQQVKWSTIPDGREPMPVLFDNLIPNVYGERLYDDRFLSPFHRVNKRYYKYSITHYSDSTALVVFTPRIDNTQLVDGRAVVNSLTGFLLSVEFRGEFDMLKFATKMKMNPENPNGTPLDSHTKATFKCLLNDIEADFTYVYNTPQTLPDSINGVFSRSMIEALRPIPVSAYHDSIYHRYDVKEDSIMLAEAGTDTIAKKEHWYKGIQDLAWEGGDRGKEDTSGKVYVRISPLFNPLYMGYSSSKGLSYKLSLYANYKWNDKRYLTLEPQLGYYTKKNQLYYTVPLTMTYNPKRNGYVRFEWANGNRTTNAKLERTFKELVGGDTISAPEFRDQHFTLHNNIGIFDWIQLSTGLKYQIRTAMDKRDLLEQADLMSTYRSFAPFVTIHLMPWQERGPVLTANFENSFKNVLGSNLDYARIELDASFRYKMKKMRQLNLRAGTGFYTTRNTDYFVDYTNFRDNNLPMGWDDDWTGQFQLLESRWYNESNYYIRGHISYESPLFALSWVPFVGRFVESERLYFSTLSIEHVKGYHEIGYGFKCKYFSTAFFASFLDRHYESFECKFTIELFNRW